MDQEPWNLNWSTVSDREGGRECAAFPVSNGKDFLNRSPTTDKWDHLKLKSRGQHYSRKEAAHRMGKIFTELYYTSDQGLLSGIYTKLKNLSNKKINNPI